MNVEFLKEVLSLPSISGNENMVRDYIIEFAQSNDIEYEVDVKGNVYLTKGRDKVTSGEYYPCVVSHIDTVHRSHIELINKNMRLDIVERGNGDLIAYNPLTNEQTGIGGDDKCGVFVCLSLFLEKDVLKGAFFVEEEIGMLGSREADPEFFSNVGYAIQFDAPSANWITEVCSGVKILDEEFKSKVKPLLNEGGYTKFSVDPFTDVNQLAQKFDFNCLNLGCGYYQQHTSGEYVVIDEVEKSLSMGIDLINFLGIHDYKRTLSETESIYNIKNLDDSEYIYNGDGVFNDDLEEECLDDAMDIVDLVFELQNEGCSKDEIIKEVSELIYYSTIFNK